MDTSLDSQDGMHYNGYFIGGERHLRPATSDGLASSYHKFRVHVFTDAATAEAWLSGEAFAN